MFSLILGPWLCSHVFLGSRPVLRLFEQPQSYRNPLAYSRKPLANQFQVRVSMENKLAQNLTLNLPAMNPVRVGEVMSNFESTMEDVDVIDETVNQAMESTTAKLTDQKEVDDLIRQVADENSLLLQELLPDLVASPGKCPPICLSLNFG